MSFSTQTRTDRGVLVSTAEFNEEEANRHDHESATRLAFAASCLAAILTLPAAHAQMGGTIPGGYGQPGAYGYGPPPNPYGYGPPPGAYGYGSAQGTYPPTRRL